jgi:protein PhnA
MNTEQALLQRSNSTCELCTSESNLAVYQIPPVTEANADKCILACDTCRDQIENPENTEANHWRCLNDSMWSQVPAVQVMAWRMLTRLAVEGWPQDLLDMLYLDDELLAWAKAADLDNEDDDAAPTLDSNGAVLQSGDTVTLIKDLNVKGAGFTAKRGTAVRNISLTNNPEHIEGRVNGVRIVLLTCYLKKS